MNSLKIIDTIIWVCPKCGGLGRLAHAYNGGCFTKAEGRRQQLRHQALVGACVAIAVSEEKK